jgi:hypothetical protein
MSRYDDLKEKGWPNLNSAERKEYGQLKANVENAEVTSLEGDETGITKQEEFKPQPIAEKFNMPSKEPSVTLTRAQLDEIVASAVEKATATATRGLERQLGLGDWKVAKEERNANKRARMRLYQKDTDSPLALIVDWKFLKNAYDENTRAYDKPIYKLTVLHDDGTKEDVEIPLLDFSKINNYETVEIIATETRKLEKVHGKVRQTMRNKEGYAMSPHPSGGTDNVMLGGWVELKEVKMDEIHTIKRPNGKTLTIHNSKLNG